MTVLLHEWSDQAGQTLKWLSPDSEDAYKRNLNDTNGRRMLEIFGWIGAEIDYKFNSQGFRTQEIDSRPNWIALGCSFTQGTGVNESDRWTDVVADSIGLHCWNLAAAGASGDTCYRIARKYIPELLPKFVVYLEPRYNRTELATDRQAAPLVINWAHDYANWSGNYVKHMLTEPANFDLNAEKNREAIRSICLQHNIPLIVYPPDGFLVCVTDKTQHDLGRDLLHPGRLNNRAFAQVVAKDVKKYA